MESSSIEQPEERDPLLWKEAHEDEVLYDLLGRHSTLQDQTAQHLRAEDESPEEIKKIQDAVIATMKEKQEIQAQIEDRLIYLGYDEPPSPQT